MARFEQNDLKLKDGQQLYFGDNDDAYMFWDGTQMVFQNITISGVPGPQGVAGSGTLGNSLFSDDGYTGITPIDEGQITFTTASATLIRMQNDGSMTIGYDTFSSTAQLDVLNNGADATLGIRSQGGGTSTQGNLIFTRSRGSVISPAIVQAGDSLGSIDWKAYDTSSTTEVNARITVEAGGPVSTDVLPMDMIFETSATKTSARTEVMKLTGDGFMYLGGGGDPANSISNDNTMADTDPYTLVTEFAVKNYVLDQLSGYTATVTGVSYIESVSVSGVGLERVACTANTISFVANDVEVAQFDSTGIFTLISGGGVNKIDTDSYLSSSEAVLENSLVTAKAVKEYVDAFGGGGGGLAYQLVSADGTSELNITSDTLGLSLSNTDYALWERGITYLGNKLNDNYGNSNEYTWDERLTRTLIIRKESGEVGLTLAGHHDGGSEGTAIRILRTRGTGTNIEPLENQDTIGGIYWHVARGSIVNSSSILQTSVAKIKVVAESDHSSAAIPASIRFYTTQDREIAGATGDATLYGTREVMRLTHTGKLELRGSGEPSFRASVNEITERIVLPVAGSTGYASYDNTTLATTKAIVDLVSNEIFKLATQSHSFTAIHNDTSGYNVTPIGIYCGSESVFSYLRSADENDTFGWECDFGDISGYGAIGSVHDAYAGFKIARAGQRNNLWMDSVSNSNDRAASNNLRFYRSMGLNGAARRPLTSIQTLGSIQASGQGTKTLQSLNVCRQGANPPRITGKIAFIAGPSYSYGVPTSITFQTGDGTTKWEDITGTLNLPVRYAMDQDGRSSWTMEHTELHPAVFGDPNKITFQLWRRSGNRRSYGSWGDAGFYMLESRGSNTTHGTMAVFSHDSISENSGGSIVLGGECHQDSGGTYQFDPDDETNPAALQAYTNFTFAKIQGAKANGAARDNGGRMRLMVHTDGTNKMKEVMRLEYNRKVLVASANSGKGFEHLPTGLIQINQHTNSTSGGFGSLNVAGTGEAFMWADTDDRACIYSASDGTGDLKLNDTGNISMSCTPNSGLLVTVGGNIGPKLDNAYNVGSITYRWNDIYATNATIQTSDGRLKTIMGREDLGLNFINSLNPVKYKWKDGGERMHHGLVAQDVEKALAGRDFAGLIKDKETGSYGLRYNELIAPLIKAIQELTDRVKELEAN
jgi:hypothetical protein